MTWDSTWGVAVVAATVIPVADAGPVQSQANLNLVTLDGSLSSDYDTLAWSFASVPVGSAVVNGSLSDATAVGPTFTPDILGVYSLTLTATNADGARSDTVSISVIADPLEIAALVDTQQDTLASITEIAPTVTGGTAPYTYAWTLKAWDGTALAFNNAALAAPSWTVAYRYAGICTLEVVVTDADGTVARASRTCEIGRDGWVHIPNNDAGYVEYGVTTYSNNETPTTIDIDGARNVGSATWIKTADKAAYHWRTVPVAIPPGRCKIKVRGIYGATQPLDASGPEYGPLISTHADPTVGTTVCGYIEWYAQLFYLYWSWGNYGGWAGTHVTDMVHDIEWQMHANQTKFLYINGQYLDAADNPMSGTSGNSQFDANRVFTLETANTVHVGYVAGVKRADANVVDVNGLDFQVWVQVRPDVTP